MSAIGKKIRILYLIGELGKGGAEKQLYLLIKHLSVDVFEPHVIVFNQCPNPAYKIKLQDVGINVHEIPITTQGVFNRSLFLFRLFKQLKPHIVHSWTVHDNPYAGYIGFLSAIPVRLGSLRSSIDYKGFKNLPKVVQYICLYSTQAITVNAQSTMDELKGKKFPDEKVMHLNNCIEISDGEPSYPNQIPFMDELPENYKIVGTVGNLRRNKNIHIFIDGLAKTISKHQDVFGVIIGQAIKDEEDYFEELTNQIAALNLQDRIILTGFLDNVSEVMRHFDAFCLLSESEGTPNVILEAMAAKCPVIASNVGDIPLIINHGINGYLVKPGCAEEFSMRLDHLLENPEHSKQMGDKGLEFVKANYSCNKTINDLQLFYKHKLREIL